MASVVGQLLAAEDLQAAPSPEILATLVLSVQSLEVAVDDARVVRLAALWEQVAQTGPPDEAWRAVITALLADPEIATY